MTFAMVSKLMRRKQKRGRKGRTIKSKNQSNQPRDWASCWKTTGHLEVFRMMKYLSVPWHPQVEDIDLEPVQ